MSRRRETYQLRNRWGTCTYYGEVGRVLYERELAERQRALTCALCDKPGAEQQLVGTGRKVHVECADEMGIPTVLRISAELDGGTS